ncbi:segregation and condensation protein B [Lactobacillus colini]|uniref:Segregation and condensation protein B n=1 Tax=Lactobacillus colini TaxID=1819254 RepID=A0ABS4MF23_9LACO|nr:SMC-Scp complex subunit ScpB [Lactobacillus colini]MBP2057979.1 segregation and condensation protein B [Lactobacillus colini]
MATKEAQLEALLYAAGDNGMAQDVLSGVLEVDTNELTEIVNKLKNKLEEDSYSGLKLVTINQTYKLITSPECSDVISEFFQKDLSKHLSQSALEILAIVAYRQPITRVEIDELRGVNSSAALQTLIWRGLIKINGKKDVPGRPNLYETTDYFLQYFNYSSLADMPVIEDFENDNSGPIDLFESKGQTDQDLK